MIGVVGARGICGGGIAAPAPFPLAMALLYSTSYCTVSVVVPPTYSMADRTIYKLTVQYRKHAPWRQIINVRVRVLVRVFRNRGTRKVIKSVRFWEMIKELR